MAYIKKLKFENARILREVFSIDNKEDLIKYFKSSKYGYAKVSRMLDNRVVHYNYFSNMTEEEYMEFANNIKEKLSFIATLPYFNPVKSNSARIKLENYREKVLRLSYFLGTDYSDYDEFEKEKRFFDTKNSSNLFNIDKTLYELYVQKRDNVMKMFYDRSVSIARQIGRGITVRDGKLVKIDSIDVLKLCRNSGMSIGKVYYEFSKVSYEDLPKNYLVSAKGMLRKFFDDGRESGSTINYDFLTNKINSKYYSTRDKVSVLEVEDANKFLIENEVDRYLICYKDAIDRSRAIEDKNKIMRK